ncbi:MAG: flagellar biosynthesis protein FliQ [Synergistaceae bacterium]|jgi:flagellar biosynthetic protein FliQ|nr:flagellar biosynthesis protein FliQ [Synergistaceae bacterium]
MEIVPVSMFDVLSGAVWTMLVVALPVLLVAMGVGLIIGILQTATSIQEQTLIFIPKILAVFIFIVLAGPWMSGKVLQMTREILGQLERFIR